MSNDLEGRIGELLRRQADAMEVPPTDGPRTVAVDLGGRSDARRVLPVLAAAAMVVAATIGAVVWNARRESPPTLGTEPTPTTAPAPQTTATPDTTSPGTTSPATNPTTSPATSTTTTAVAAGPEETSDPSLVVSYRDPPLTYRPRVDLTVRVSSQPGSLPRLVAANATHVVVIDRSASQAVLVERSTGAQTRVDLDVVPVDVVLGTSNVLYGLVQTEPTGFLAVVAIPLASGEASGHVGASADVESVKYVERATEILGLGADGIIDRSDGTLLLPYLGGEAPPPARADGETWQYVQWRVDPVRYTTVDGPHQWQPVIERSPDAPELYNGDSPAAPAADGGATIWTWIGPGLADGTPTLPVIGSLHPDGSASWISLPDDWAVVDSGPFGTTLARNTPSEVELAVLPSADPVDQTLLPAEWSDTDEFGVVAVGVDRNVTPRAPTEDLIDVIRQQLTARPADCDVPSRIARYDATTLRFTFGCDDSTGGIDYRIVAVEGAGAFDVAVVQRRQLCLRAASGEACT